MQPGISAEPKQAIIFNSLERWPDPSHRDLFLRGIFPNSEDFVQELSEAFRAQAIACDSIGDLLKILNQMFLDNVDLPRRHLASLRSFEKQLEHSLTAYQPLNKPNPEAVFWPNPLRDSAKSIYETWPLVQKTELVNRQTVLGSAGSCFAHEIAYYFQENNYRYFVSEKEHEPDNGIYLDAFDPKQKFSRFSANWGILFNTPSFTQLVEKAFGEKPLPKLLVEQESSEGKTIYVDPFRENVYFRSAEDFHNNYEKHCAAIRRVFSEVEVFIMTFGLNECWEYAPTGSVISRNPRSSGLAGLLRHRVLSVEENVQYIERFLKIVRAHNPRFQLIISVSPIPLIATGRAQEMHVVAANAHSKATLRVAANEIVRRNEGVHYFPSYEMVTVCTKDPFEEDQRHVKRSTVQRVMELFEKSFVSGFN